MEVKYPDIKIEMLMPQRRAAVAKVLEQVSRILFKQPWLSIPHAIELAPTLDVTAKGRAVEFIRSCLDGKPFQTWLAEANAKHIFAEEYGSFQRRWLFQVITKLSSQRPVRVSFEDPQYDDYNGWRNIRIRIVKVVWCNGAKVGIVYTDSSSLRYRVSIDLVRRARPNTELACNFSRMTLQGAYNTATKVIHRQVAAVLNLTSKKEST